MAIRLINSTVCLFYFFFFLLFFIKFLNFFRYASNFQFIWESNIRSTSSSFLRFSFEIHNENFFLNFFFLVFWLLLPLGDDNSSKLLEYFRYFCDHFWCFLRGVYFACFTSETKSNQQMECGMEAIWSIFAHIQLRLVLFQPDTVWWICCGYWRWHLMSIRHWRETVVMDWWDAFGVWGGWWRRRCIWSGYCCRCGLMDWMHVVVLNDSGQIAKFWNWRGICEYQMVALRFWWRWSHTIVRLLRNSQRCVLPRSATTFSTTTCTLARFWLPFACLKSKNSINIQTARTHLEARQLFTWIVSFFMANGRWTLCSL